jgi:hypothetical protein
MKNLAKRQWLFLFALIAVFSISSCNDDEDGPSNSARVEDDKISLSKGYIITDDNVVDDEEETGSVHTIYLMSKGLTLDADNNEIDGEGDVVAFALFSASNNELDEGIYEIKSEQLPGSATQFIMATAYNWNDGVPEYDNSYTGTYGTIDVSKSGDTYTLKFRVTSYMVNDGGGAEEGDDELTGYFKGKLEVVELEEPAARMSPFNIF